MSDLIDRQAAIDAMFANMPGLMFNDVLRILRTLPSAQPERKRGKWIKGTVRHKITGELRPALRCSFCGLSLFNEYESEERDDDFVPKYCPECGADMRTPTQVQLDEADDVMMGGDNGKAD